MSKSFITFVAMMLLLAPAVDGQDYKEQIKERQELKKASRKELDEKASKDARKEAKKLVKEGWKTPPGALPLEKQLDRSYIMQFQFDDEGFPKYIMADGMSVGGNYDAAKMQALELAKQNLAGQIQSEVGSLIETSVANNQLDGNDAESITKSVMAAKSLISNSIGRIIPVVEAYREIKSNKNSQVLVRVAYSQEMARKAAKKAIKKSLEEQGNALHGKLDEILNW
ncbi:MAG: hypothetical protein K2L05_01965 [Muribaculaceae bacterium]|nr:hypothetical protein [Muribaculaceae bacterium]